MCTKKQADTEAKKAKSASECLPYMLVHEKMMTHNHTDHDSHSETVLQSSLKNTSISSDSHSSDDEFEQPRRV